jgi:hypothetical protein
VNYRDFDLHLRRSGRRYVAHVIHSDAGEADEQFSLPFTELEIENLILKLRPSSSNRGASASNENAAKKLGGELYNAVFQGKVALRLASCIQLASQPQTKVRIRLRLDAAPELASLPWEFLYDESLNRFLSLSKETALVRYIDHPRPLDALSVSAPLKALVMISSPNDLPSLNVEAEWQKLQQSFGQFPAGLVQVHRLAQASLAELDHQLSRDSYHIFHYIGHGLFDDPTGTSSLALEDENGGSFEIAGEKIGIHLHNHTSLRMVILNACEGARATTHDMYSGIAQGLIRCGIPAVIGMQFEISDKAAIAFSSRFYDAIARGKPVDESLDEARLAIHAAQNGGTEWGTPVLYLRAQDGNLFNIKDSPEPEKSAVSAPLEEKQESRIAVALPRAAPTGTLDSNSPFYIERKAEKKAIELVTDDVLTLVILAPGQCGGSTLLHRMLSIAEKDLRKCVYLNFQDIFSSGGMDDAQDFYRTFCKEITNSLGLDDRVGSHWDRYSGTAPPRICTAYIQGLLQSQRGEKFILALDETDLLFETPLKSDFFAMLRSWHNRRARHPEFRQLGFIFLTSIDRGLLIDGSTQSGFNVGEVVYLDDFNELDIAQLSLRYGLQFSEKQTQELMAMLGGHPSLHQLALHHLAQSRVSPDVFLSQAKNAGSPFRPHLESHYANLRRQPKLYQGVEKVLKNGEPDETIIMQLRRAGLIQREGNKVQFRCKLYREYFSEQFRVS